MAKTGMTAGEKKMYLEREPRVCDVMNSLVGQRRLPKVILKDVEKAVAIARKFNDEVVRPAYRDVDLRVARDPDYLTWDFIEKANEWGLYTLFSPKIYGGKGLDLLALYPFLEEIASVCTGLSNVIGVHYLGIVTMGASWNARLINRIGMDVRRGEKTGKPCLISLTITEPDAGTDVEETELLEKARIGSSVKKVEGGFILNGRKIFISNGHVSEWHMVISYEDRSRPAETMVMLAVKTGAKGFSFGNHEKKMGQRACVASELIFDDCFVPDENICIRAATDSDKFKKSNFEISQLLIDYVVSSSRVGVAAFGVGCARGAYETALNYARKKTVNGKLLINHQWAQCILSEMYKNVNMARASYMESAYADALTGSPA